MTMSASRGFVDLHRYCQVASRTAVPIYSQRESGWNCSRAAKVSACRGLPDAARHPSHRPSHALRDPVHRPGRCWGKCLLHLVSCTSALAWLLKRGFRKGFPEQGGGLINLRPAQSPGFPEKVRLETAD